MAETKKSQYEAMIAVRVNLGDGEASWGLSVLQETGGVRDTHPLDKERELGVVASPVPVWKVWDLPKQIGREVAKIVHDGLEREMGLSDPNPHPED